MFDYADLNVMQHKIQSLEKEMFILNKIISDASDSEQDYLKVCLKTDLYLANLYIDLMLEIPTVARAVKKPHILNLMSFSQFVRDTKFLLRNL